MTRTHRRIQDGGNPAQGPVPELANEPPSPRDVDELPDRPEDNEPGHEPRRDEDQPDPDAFAERLGLTHHGTAGTAATSDTTSHAVGRTRRAAAAMLHGIGRAAAAVERTFGRWADRLRS